MHHDWEVGSLRLPLLITGLAGVAGYNAFRYLSAKYPGQVIATRRVDNWPLRGDGIIGCDADDGDRLARLFDQYQFQSVLNSEGSCALKSCELDPQMAQRVNVDSVDNLLTTIEGSDVRLVHLSIDLVFSGRGDGQHVEEDPTDPVTVYGKTMVAAEQLILTRRPQACVLRISLPMGVSFNGHAGAIDWIQSRFKKSKPATLYYDEIRSPTYTDCLSLLLEDVLRRDLAGLYHAGGPRHLSLYQIAQVINRVGGYDPNLLIGCFRHEAGPLPPRAGNVTMQSEKLIEALGYSPFTPWPWFDEHYPTDQEWHYGDGRYRCGSPQLLESVLYQNPSRNVVARKSL
ncbi:MAG: sugar nucleotide-binding protein [Planctomycetaceae bacterium]|nr:sugar nucleotide-binding protein [Planctomycetales bacterium]MCB9927677.1 sugar nucleotide-binding protein [Planctomycetaceae bacterium]